MSNMQNKLNLRFYVINLKNDREVKNLYAARSQNIICLI